MKLRVPAWLKDAFRASWVEALQELLMLVWALLLVWNFLNHPKPAGWYWAAFYAWGFVTTFGRWMSDRRRRDLSHIEWELARILALLFGRDGGEVLPRRGDHGRFSV